MTEVYLHHAGIIALVNHPEEYQNLHHVDMLSW